VDRACKNTELGRAPKFGAMEYIRLLHVLNEPTTARALAAITQPKNRDDIEVQKVDAWNVFTEKFNDASYAPEHVTTDTNKFETCGENGRIIKVHDRDARQLKRHYGLLKTEFTKYYTKWSASGQSDDYGDQKDFRQDFLSYRNTLTEEVKEVYEYMFYFLKEKPSLDMFHRGVPTELQQSATASGTFLDNDADIERRNANRRKRKRSGLDPDKLVEVMSETYKSPMSSLCDEERSNLEEQTNYFKAQIWREERSEKREQEREKREQERHKLELERLELEKRRFKIEEKRAEREEKLAEREDKRAEREDKRAEREELREELREIEHLLKGDSMKTDKDMEKLLQSKRNRILQKLYA